MTIDAYASAPHYLAHIVSIWQSIPVSQRGRFFVHSGTAVEANKRGIEVTQGAVRGSSDPIIVASYSDYRHTGRRPVIFVEHGAGQTYLQVAGHSAYSGGRARDRTILFICPNETVADRNRSRYPHIPTAIVGCPRIDHIFRSSPPPRSIKSPPTIAITFHANLNIVPETSSAFRYFHPMIQHLLDAGYTNLLGHGHPRIYQRLRRIYGDYGIASTSDPDEVMTKADVLCLDNSSFGFECASVGIRLVWLSPPFYRRDTVHGLRFWDALILGPEATSPDEVPAAVVQALATVPGDLYHQREKFLDTVYAYRDEYAGERAAEAIVRLVAEMETV